MAGTMSSMQMCILRVLTLTLAAAVFLCIISIPSKSHRELSLQKIKMLENKAIK